MTFHNPGHEDVKALADEVQQRFAAA